MQKQQHDDEGLYVRLTAVEKNIHAEHTGRLGIPCDEPFSVESARTYDGWMVTYRIPFGFLRFE